MMDPDRDPDGAAWLDVRSRAFRRVVLGVLCGVTGFVLLLVSQPLWSPRYHALRAANYLARAERFAGEERREEARLMLWNALRHDPNDAATWRLYGRLVRPEDGVPEYLDVLWQASLRNPDDAPAAASFLKGCLQHGVSAGESNLVRVLSRHGQDADVLYYAAMLHAQAGRSDLCRALLGRALVRAPWHEAANFSKALLTLDEAGADPQRALAALQVQSEGGRFRVPALQVLGTYWASRQPSRAVAYFDQLLALAPGHWQVRVRRAELVRQGHPERTGDLLADLGQHAGTGSQTYDLLSLTLVWRGEAALADVLRSLPGALYQTPEVGRFEVERLAGRGDWTEVVRVATRRTELHREPGDALVFWLWLARGLHEQRDSSTPEAVRFPLGRAATLVRRNPELVPEAARLVEGWGAHPFTIAYYETLAAEIPALRATSLRRLFTFHQESTNAAGALAAVTQLAALVPNDPDVAHLQVALQLVTGASPGEALARAQQLAREHPGQVRAVVNLARAQVAVGQPAEAAALYDTLPAATWADPVFRLHRADAWDRIGRRDEARREVEALSESGLYPGDAVILRRIREGAPAGPGEPGGAQR